MLAAKIITNPKTDWKNDPDQAGAWLVKTTEDNLFDADVREYLPGCFEALIHGYSYTWNPTSCLHGLQWAFKKPNKS
jgi:hypothetical protein